MHTEVIKFNLIKQIMELDDIAKLKKIGRVIDNIGSENDLWSNLVRPLRKRLDIEELKKDQNYKPIDKAAFFQKIETLNIEESIEELLAMV